VFHANLSHINASLTVRRVGPNVDRVVIYRLGSIGDTVAALPCFHLVARAFPDAERLVLTNVPVSGKAAPLESILLAGGLIHGSIAYPLGMRDPVALARLGNELRRLNSDTLIYMAASRGLATAWRDVGYFRLCGFSRIIGAPLSRDLQRNRVGPDGDIERESHRLGRTVAALGPIDFADRAEWDLRLTGDERRIAASAISSLAGHPILAVNTGGKWRENDWGEDNWFALLRTLSDALPAAGLIFVGASDDVERATRLSRAWRAGCVVDLCGRLKPRESAAALASAALFIGHDSGPMHLADAVGTPCIGLLGSHNPPKMWHPSGPCTTIIHRLDGVTCIVPSDVAHLALGKLARGRSLDR